jgi:hypothetical protein
MHLQVSDNIALMARWSVVVVVVFVILSTQSSLPSNLTHFVFIADVPYQYESRLAISYMLLG